MTNRETVQQGLDARKDVMAANARTDKFRKKAADINEARFLDNMRYQLERNELQNELETLQGTVRCQNRILRQMREDVEECHRRERDARQRRILLSAVKAAALFVVLICIRDLDLIVSWLNSSLLGLTFTWFFCASTALVKNQNPTKEE